MSEENAAQPRVSGYAWYALILFVVVYIFNFIDRQIVSILAESIKADLKLDDAQIGFLYGTAFAIFYSLFGIPLGRLADSWYRGRLMAIGLALWSSMTALVRPCPELRDARRRARRSGDRRSERVARGLFDDRRLFPEGEACDRFVHLLERALHRRRDRPAARRVRSGLGAARDYPAASAIAPWQAAFLAVGLPGLLLAVWIWGLKEPLRGAIDGHPSEIVHPNAWREFGRELVAIIPPLTLFSAARLGALTPNLLALGLAILGAGLLGSLTGDWPQWIAWFTGVYAVFSWTQSLKRRDPATHKLIWGTPIALMLVVAFGSISFMTYAVAFWIPPYLLRTFYAGPTGAAVFLQGATAAEEVSTLFGWAAAAASAIGVILGGIVSDSTASTSSGRKALREHGRNRPARARRSIGHSRRTASRPSTCSRRTSACAARSGLGRR